MLSSSMLDYPITKLFSEMYRLKLICSDERKQVWYAFEGNKWNKLSDSAYVRRCIEEEFSTSLDLFTMRLLERNDFFTEELNDHEKEIVSLILAKDLTKNELNTIERIRLMCWSEKFSNKIFRMSSRYLHSSNFTRKLNRNPCLFGFDNGVLDLKNRSLSEDGFREGYPDDFLSMSTSISYAPSDAEKRKTLMTILEKIFPEDDVLEYVLRFISSCLRSKNVDKIFSIWTGSGDNGKSVMVSLVEKAFGEYCAKVPTSLLVSKRSASSSATPELCIIEDRKIVFAQEPSEGEKLNPGLIKELTGGDTVYARSLYEEGKNINVDAKLVLVSNKVPKVNEMTRAIWSRIRVVPFKSLFVSEHEYEEETKKHPGKNIFIRDPNIDDKLKNLASEFMSLLIEKYDVWMKNGLNEPASISKITEEVKMMNDSVGEFLRERAKKREGFKMGRGEVYEVYQQWLKTNYPKKHPADVQSFNAQMNVHGFYCDQQGRYIDINI
jgi:P4 family phage/plasmid primase-like protien